MIKVLETAGLEETHFSVINSIFHMCIYNGPTANVNLKGETFEAIP